MFKFMFGVQANRGRFRKELNKLKEILAPSVQELAPWDEEQLELLSIDLDDIKVKRGLNKTVHGSLYNIYHEPVISYAYRCYFGNEQNAILLAQTSDHELVYAIGKKDISTYCDGVNIGKINHDGSLFSTQGKLDVKLIQDENLSILPLQIQGEKVAGLNNPANDYTGNNRALLLFRDLNNLETKKILAVSVLELLSYKVI